MILTFPRHIENLENRKGIQNRIVLQALVVGERASRKTRLFTNLQLVKFIESSKSCNQLNSGFEVWKNAIF